jgi:tRNA (cytidine/uridine-2'-O-)-methyltransferase
MKVAFYQPDIAANLAAMLRTAACLDLEIHIIEPCGFVFDMQKIKRIAMDYIDFVKIIRHNSFEDFYQNEIIKNHNRLILLTTKSKNSYYDFKFQKNDILLLGRESAGVTEEVANLCNYQITIPMKNNMRSLNIGIAATLVLGEAIRQIKD